MSLEDIEEIRQVRAKYYIAVDERRWDDAIEFYSDTASIDIAGGIKGHTKKVIKEVLLDRLASTTSATFHLGYFPLVEVNGDTATAVGYVETHTVPIGVEEPFSQIARLDDQYIKENGKWKLKNAVYTVLIQSNKSGKLIQKKFQ